MNDNITDISKTRDDKMKGAIKNKFFDELNQIQQQKDKINIGQLKEAILTLLDHAIGDYGGAKRCAMFLLSLWDGDTFKADLQDLLYNDFEIFNDMIIVLEGLAYTNTQLDSFLSDDQMKPIIEIWGKAFNKAES